MDAPKAADKTVPKMSSRQSFFSLDPDQKPSTEMSRNPFLGSTGGSPSPFDAMVAEAMEHWHVPGLAIAVIDRKHVTSKGYGFARLNLDTESSSEKEGEEAVPVTPQTLFDLASMSKSFTAAAMALLVEDKGMKDVDWRTPVSKLYSEFKFENESATANISVEDILSHRSGLPGHDESLRGVKHKNPDTLESVVYNMRNLPLSRPLRTEYQYSNLLYSAAAHLVSTLSNTDFGDFLRSRFWEPLQMKRTFLGPDNIPELEQPHDAQGHCWLRKKSQYKRIPHIPEPEGVGCGTIISNVEDVARWICAFLHQNPILSESSYKELAKPRILASSNSKIPYLSPTFYALGWEVSWYRGHAIIKHDGSWAGFTGSMLYIPSIEWGMVVLGNSEDASTVGLELTYHLLDDILGIPPSQRFDWRAHLDKQMEWEPDTKEELYPELKDREPDSTTPDLKRFAGTYANKGYHEIELRYNKDDECLEVDNSDRPYSHSIRIKEHAYEHWFVAHFIDRNSEEGGTVRCQFDVDEDGKSKSFGIQYVEELDDLIWFERVAVDDES